MAVTPFPSCGSTLAKHYLACVVSAGFEPASPVPIRGVTQAGIHSRLRQPINREALPLPQFKRPLTVIPSDTAVLFLVGHIQL